MNESLINEIMIEMSALLDCRQLHQLGDILKLKLGASEQQDVSNKDLLQLFLDAKSVEGRSDKTLVYYEATISNFLAVEEKPLCQVTSSDLRVYLGSYQQRNGSSKVTIDNIRRIFSSFFSWLEDEEYVAKSPVRRIHKVKAPQVVKEIISDEAMETLRDNCRNKRDLAIVDLLASTGMRVGELVKLNISDLNLHERECLVHGKGDKQRKAYFDTRAKLHLQAYLDTRNDCNPALFVSLNAPYKRFQSGGVELRIRNLSKQLDLPRVHPHKFRRTLATNAIDKGMPIEQVQRLLGHARIDTTMHYALVNQNNVKLSHRRYLG